MSGELAFEWARVLVRALVEAGVRLAVASPGSRSTPLMLAAAAEPRLDLEVVVDERSAAFFALGAARVSGTPSLLLCTSGSAGAHYLPAILEAQRSLLPLIALTADRPWELARLHANQTLEQRGMLGLPTLELGEPDADRLAFVPRIAAVAVQRATLPVPGPVHLNARFRKPLEPSGPTRELALPPVRVEHAASTRVAVPAALADAIAKARRGLVVCGPRRGPASGDARLGRALGRFTRERGFALVAEVTSGVAHGPECEVLPAFDAWLPNALSQGDAPDLVLELGSPPTSAAWERLAPTLGSRVVVSEDGFPDPTGTASAVVVASPALLVEALDPSGPRDRDWLARMAERAVRAERLLAEVCEGACLSEPALAQSVFSALPDGATVLLGNSLSVRDADLFASRSRRAVTVLHQRGLSGIDGLIAGAAGAKRALGPALPLFALIGDVSALHDLGSLGLIARAEGPLTLVVVDNGGGQIFSELPVARAVSSATLERLFLTPPPAGFLEHSARAFGLAYERVSTRPELDRVLGARAEGPRVVHALVSPDDGRARRRAVREALAVRA